MRILPGAFGILLLLALLTWLLLRGIDTNAPAYAMTLKAFDDFAIAEASLQRDLLQARAGLLRNYDTLVRAVEAIEDAVARLRLRVQSDGLDTGPVDRLAATVAQQEELTERFKSSNAILQNSLSYVGLLSTGQMSDAEDTRPAPDPGSAVPPVRRRAALAAAILNVTRDTSPDAVKVLHEQIDRFAAQTLAVGPDAEAAQALLSHARLLIDLLPGVDATLKALFAVPSKQPLKRPVPSSPVAEQMSKRQHGGLIIAIPRVATVAHHARASRYAAARSRACAAPASGIRTCSRREFDAPNQLLPGRDRGAIATSA